MILLLNFSRIVCGFLGLIFATQGAQANPFAGSSKNADLPIGITADSIVADVQNQSATYMGNVVVTQGEIKLRSDSLTIKAAKGEISRIDAKGNVVLATRDGAASGANAQYDVLSRLVVMSGKVVLTQGQNVMRGTRLVVNLGTGEAKLTAGGEGVSTSSGGRVEGLFVPAKSKPSQKPTTPAAPSVAPTPAQ